MGRWEPDAAARLERAALALFTEQGYASTTVPQIATRAGLTTRSFFRHFADKREVLFFRERELPDVVSSVIAGLPASLSPIELVMQGLDAVTATRFTEWRDDLIARRAVVQADAHLRERELLKLSVLSGSILRGLLDHGVEERTATLLAPITVTVFDTALNRWLDSDGSRPLRSIVQDTQQALWSALGLRAATPRGAAAPADAIAQPTSPHAVVGTAPGKDSR